MCGTRKRSAPLPLFGASLLTFAALISAPSAQARPKAAKAAATVTVD